MSTLAGGDDRPLGHDEPHRLPAEHLSGLSFATDDLITPPSKQDIANAEKEVMQVHKLYQRGIITEGERYNQVLDRWTHAREEITANDDGDGERPSHAWPT